MVDFTGKIPDGIYLNSLHVAGHDFPVGVHSSIGSYQACMDINVPNDHGHSIQGRHSMIELSACSDNCGAMGLRLDEKMEQTKGYQLDGGFRGLKHHWNSVEKLDKQLVLGAPGLDVGGAMF